jgi:hypothetical protein
MRVDATGAFRFPTYPVAPAPRNINGYLTQSLGVRVHFAADHRTMGRSLDVEFTQPAEGGGDLLAFVKVVLPGWSGGPVTPTGPMMKVDPTPVKVNFTGGEKPEDCARSFAAAVARSAKGFNVQQKGNTVMITEQMHPL